MSEILDELQAHYIGVEQLPEDASHAGDFEELMADLRDLESRRAKSSD